MKLQQGKWYVCVGDWSDDGWTKFYDGMLVRCDKDNVLVDAWGISHVFLEDDEPERIFREATDTERNIVSATEVNRDEFRMDVSHFEAGSTLKDIYRRGAEDMLQYIKRNMRVKR